MRSRRALRRTLALLCLPALVAACAAGGGSAGAVDVEGDGIPAPLRGLTGDAARGRSLVAAREAANCILCHAVPGVPIAGNLAPSLAGVGSRLDAAQLRLRVVDQKRIVPTTIMPSYYRTEGLVDVAPEYRGRPVLDAQAVEDIVAWLCTLR